MQKCTCIHIFLQYLSCASNACLRNNLAYLLIGCLVDHRSPSTFGCFHFSCVKFLITSSFFSAKRCCSAKYFVIILCDSKPCLQLHCLFLLHHWLRCRSHLDCISDSLQKKSSTMYIIKVTDTRQKYHRDNSHLSSRGRIPLGVIHISADAGRGRGV